MVWVAASGMAEAAGTARLEHSRPSGLAFCTRGLRPTGQTRGDRGANLSTRAGEGNRRRSGDCDSTVALPAFAGGDCGFAFEEEAGALDDRHVDHLAVDGDGADAFGECLVVGGDDAAGVIDFLRAGTELLVQDRDLAP